jgi:signal transduction histidine kinase
VSSAPGALRSGPERRGLRRATGVVRAVFGGLGTGFLALAGVLVVLVVAVLHLVLVGQRLAPGALRLVRRVADRERRRQHRLDPAVLQPEDARPPASYAAALRDPDERRELGWLLLHGTLGLVLSLLGVLVVVYVVQDLTFPLWFRLIALPDRTYPWPQVEGWYATSVPTAAPAVLFGLVLAAVAAAALPVTALVQRQAALQLLNPPPGADLRLRVTELTASRAAALEAHTAELRRIERVLHDGAQSRLVAVSVLLGAARRAVERGDADAVQHLERAQTAVEDALVDLRGVVRDILPPVLSDRGLAAALDGLAQRCAVPCTLDAAEVGRCPASIEATVYYVVAEALTNVSRHSGATRARVTLRRAGDELTVVIADDGVGGADADGGSGLRGIRQRVLAHDGALTVSSPAGGPTRIEAVLPCGT